MSNTQAQILLNQLGGNKFIAMTGAKDFGISKEGLSFKIGKNSKGVSHVKIRLSSLDLYDMKFINIRAGNIKIKAEIKGVYCDQLETFFKKYTGMDTRLF